MKLVPFYLLLLNILLCNNLYIDKIIIDGNHAIKNNEIYKSMTLKRPSLFIRTEFSNKILEQDLQNIIGLYKMNGYLDVEIKTNTYKQKNNYLNITYMVNEGRQYYLNDLIVVGNALIDNQSISRLFRKKKSKEFNPSFIAKKIFELKRLYLTKGRLNINIVDELIIKDNQVDLKLKIVEGEKYKINKIYIHNLKSVDEKYVLRELTFNRNEIFNIVKIEEARKRIFDSGLFSSVDIVPEIVNQQLNLIDININLREFKTSSIEADIGFSEITAWQNNLITPAIEINGKWTIGNIYNTASNIIFSSGIASELNFKSLEDNDNLSKINTIITYKSPWTLNFRLPTKIDLFYNFQRYDEVNIKRIGASYNLYWEKDISTTHTSALTYETIRSDSIRIIEENEPIKSIEYNFIKNKVKNIFSPKGGYYHHLKFMIFGGFLGGERNFIKSSYEYKKYMEIFKRGVLAIRIKCGYIKIFDDKQKIPLYYLFQLGGQSSLRGWTSPESFSAPKNKFELFNLEYRFPIYKKWGGGLFYDAGSLLNTNKLLMYDFKHNYGIGITYDTAIGPIRLDYAIPKKYKNIKNGTIHASILYIF